MNEKIFWQLIKETKEIGNGDKYAQKKELIKLLSSLSVEEIIGFDKLYNEFSAEAYTSDLWAAAYIINGGCSDDGFDYFRGWLISEGKEVFENALKNPESLVNVDVEEEEAEFEDILYVAVKAYEIKTGKDDFYNLIKRTKYPEIQIEWDEDDDQLEEMFPKLFEKFY